MPNLYSKQIRAKSIFLKLTPLRITIVYAMIGSSWIYFSDSLLQSFSSDPDEITRIAILKGWLYVGVTALILYLLIRFFERTQLASEQQYRMLLEQASDGILIFDRNGNYYTVNAQACKMLGYAEQELLQLDIRDLFLQEDLLARPLRFEEMIAGKTIFSDRNMRRKDGSVFPSESSVKMLGDGRFQAIVRDVSEHRKKDEMLALRSRQLELLLKSNREINTVLEIPVVLRTLVNTARSLTDASSGIAGIMLGSKMIFKEFNRRGNLVPFEYSYDPGYGIPGWIMQTKKPYICNDADHDTIVTPDIRQKLGFYNFAAVPIIDHKNKLLGCFILHDKMDRRPFTDRDIEILESLAAGAAVAMDNATLLEEHLRVETSLRASEMKFRMLTDTTAVAIFIYQGSTIQFVNSACEKMTGYTQAELLTMDYWDLVHPDYWKIVKDRIAARQRQDGISVPSRYELKMLTKNGEERWVDLTSGIIEFEGRKAVLGTAYDVTERKKLEEQFRQAHKMEAVGLLAGGVAHDFNNILSAIVGYGHLAKMKLKDDDPVVPYVNEILSASERAANLTRSLLAFSRKQIINPQPLKVNEIVVGIGRFLTRIIGEDIELKIALTERDLTILADAGQIEQILMNLVTNARDSMPTGGALTIKTEHTVMDQEFVKRHGYGSQGSYALLSMTDSGSGMDKKTRDRIFEPFFTTKEMGKGTGLGLSMVYGIVKQHEGFISVYSEPGMGTTVKIYFPIVDQAVSKAEVAKPIGSIRGTETVLVAEDDELVRILTTTLLTEAGYTVITAMNGEEAVARFIENEDRVSLLIFDLILPKKNGKEAYEEIRRERRETKVIFMSGYAGDIFEKQNIPAQGLTFISKPIKPSEFLRKVRETLDN